MQRHGGKTVFFGRFVAILRFTAAWVAGLGRMPWWRSSSGTPPAGIVWATAVGLVAYYGGKAAADAIAQLRPLRRRRHRRRSSSSAVLVMHFGKKRLEERL